MRLSITEKYIIVFFIAALFASDLNSQLRPGNPIQFAGIIRDEFNSPLPYSHLIIITSGHGAIADQRGRFSFIVYPNDTLIVSSLGYKRETVIIPESIERIQYTLDITLERDTFDIREVTIFPWATYEQFIEAVLALDMPETDYDRAIANIALIQTWIEYKGLAADPAASFRMAMASHHNRSMYAGQPPNNLLNPFAWGKFIQAIRDGSFDRR